MAWSFPTEWRNEVFRFQLDVVVLYLHVGLLYMRMLSRVITLIEGRAVADDACRCRSPHSRTLSVDRPFQIVFYVFADL